MKLKPRNYQEKDYEQYIQSLTKTNMQKLFLENFGGWSDEVSKKKFFKVVENGFVELFFLEGVFVGYVSSNMERDHKDSYLINDIHLEKKFQRKGYGTEILNFVEEKVKKLKGKRLKVFVFKANPSLEFYKKVGFKEIEYIGHSKTYILVRKIKYNNL